MSRHSTLLAACLAFGLAAAAQAQFSFGIGTGGGSGFYYGRGGGYGPGYYGRGYYPGYYGPGYGRGGVGLRVGNFGYYDYDDDYGARGYYYSRPPVNHYYVLPSNSVQSRQGVVLPNNKVAATKLTLAEGDILIKSPADAPGSVGYGINDKWVYTIKPGEKQKLAAGRQWTIEFERGIDGAEPARYALDPGIYQFTYAEESGWDLAHVKDSVLPSPPAAPPATDDVGLPAEPPPE